MKITKLVLTNECFRIGNPSPNMTVAAIGPKYVLIANEQGELEKQSSVDPNPVHSNLLTAYNLLGDVMLDMIDCFIFQTQNGIVFISNEYPSCRPEVAQALKSRGITDTFNVIQVEDL